MQYLDGHHMIEDQIGLERLVENRIAESWTLDFKKDIDRDGKELPSGDAKKSFLQNVTSMANTHGGIILYGVVETEGRAAKIPGMSVGNQDQFQLALDNLITDCVAPHLSGVDFSWIDLASGNTVLIVSIPKSLLSPHVVKYRGYWRFHVRHSNGKHPMDLTELKQAFLASGSQRTHAVALRDQRFAEICERSIFTGGSTPEELKNVPTVILHMIPALHGEGLSVVDPVSLKHSLEENLTFGRFFDRWNFSFDGVIGIEPTNDDREKVKSKFLMTREGMLELILGSYWRSDDTGNWLVSSYEKDIVSMVSSTIEIYQEYKFLPPIYIFLSLRGFPSYRMLFPQVGLGRQPMRKINRDPMLSRPILISDFNCDVPSLLKPIFDPIWNECGKEHSWNYAEDGTWKWD